MVYADAGVYNTVYDGNPGPYISTAVTALLWKTVPGLGSYWWVGLQNGEIFLNESLITTVGGAVNRFFWTPAFALFLLESDDPTTYAYNPSNTVTLTFGGGQSLKVYPNTSYTGGIVLPNKWSSVNMKYIGGTDYLLVSAQGATYF